LLPFWVIYTVNQKQKDVMMSFPSSPHKDEENNVEITLSDTDFITDVSDYMVDEDYGNYNFSVDEHSTTEDDVSVDTSIVTPSIVIVHQIADDIFAQTVQDSVLDERRQAKEKVQREIRLKASIQQESNDPKSEELHSESEATMEDDDSDILINNGIHGRKKKKNTIMDNINTLSSTILTSTNSYIHKINPIKTTIVTKDVDDVEMVEEIETQILHTPTKIPPSPKSYVSTPSRIAANFFPLITRSPEKRSSNEMIESVPISRPQSTDFSETDTKIDFLGIIIKDEQKAQDDVRTREENVGKLTRHSSSSQRSTATYENTPPKQQFFERLDETVLVQDENSTKSSKVEEIIVEIPNMIDLEPIVQPLGSHCSELESLPYKCNNRGYILNIPEDSLLNIFCFLNKDSTDISVNLVCRSWHSVAIHDILWQDEYLAFINNKSHQRHSGLLTYVREFTSIHKKDFRKHLINARKERDRFKKRTLAENDYRNLRKYLFLNTLVLVPIIFTLCLIASTLLVGAYADGYLGQGLQNVAYVFIPQGVAMFMSIQGIISFLLRETILFKYGFYDQVHLLRFLILSLLPLTFYVCIICIVLKLFILQSVPFTILTIPCLVVYISYCCIAVGVLVKRYSKKRLELRRIINQLRKNSILSADNEDNLQAQQEKRRRYEDAKEMLLVWQKHRVFTRSRYLVQPTSKHYTDVSDDEDDVAQSSLSSEVSESVSDYSDDRTEKTEEELADEHMQLMVTRIQRNDDVSIGLLYTTISIIMLCIGLTILILPLKIDGYISSSWAACLTPLYLLMCTYIVGIPTFLAWQFLTDTGMTELLYAFDAHKRKGHRNRRKPRRAIGREVVGGIHWSRIRKLFASTTQHNYDNGDDDTEKDVGFCAFSVIPICLGIPGIIALALITASLSGASMPMIAGCAVLAFWEFLLTGLFIIFALPFALTHNTGF
jgi:hypothetical protein